MSEQDRVAAIVHIQGKTEEAEHIDIGINFLEKETPEEWYAKLTKFADLIEKRRAYNNERVQGEFQKAREAALALKAAREAAESQK